MTTSDDLPLGGTEQVLRRAFLRAREHGERALPAGRHAPELGILSIVEAAGPLSQRRLGEILAVNRSMMVKIIDRLEADGLLARERNPADRRNYALRGTDAGRAALAEMTRSAGAGEAALTAGLTPAERTRLVALLRRMAPDLPPSLPTALTGLAGFLLARVHLRVSSGTRDALAGLGLGARQLALLDALAAIQPCPQRRLAEHLGVSGPAIVATVNELEQDGLIARRRNPRDRREQVLTLTDAGHRRRTEAHDRLATAWRDLSAGLTPADLAELRALLSRLAP